jgi:hypothetical protein
MGEIGTEHLHDETVVYVLQAKASCETLPPQNNRQIDGILEERGASSSCMDCLNCQHGVQRVVAEVKHNSSCKGLPGIALCPAWLVIVLFGH